MYTAAYTRLKPLTVSVSGEECSTKPKENITEAPSELPGKKKYIPPYTPKSALDNVRNNPAPKPSPSPVKVSSGISGKPANRPPSSSSRPSQSSFGGHRHPVPGSSKKRRAKHSDDELDVESKPEFTFEAYSILLTMAIKA